MCTAIERRRRVCWCIVCLVWCVVLVNGQEPFPIRLEGGSVSSEGRVEVYINGEWGTVCDDYFFLYEGKAVCLQLNYTGIVRVVLNGGFGPGSGPIWLDNVDCPHGNETSIGQCGHNGIGTHNCAHSEDVGVVCDADNPGEDGAIRLVGGSDQSEGRVEIFHNREWGTICDSNWDLNDAGVVCRQLGYQSAREALREAHFGGGVGRIWLSGVECSGSERRLDQCVSGGWGNTPRCSHALHDASVVCQGRLPVPSPTRMTRVGTSMVSLCETCDLSIASTTVRSSPPDTTRPLATSTSIVSTYTPLFNNDDLGVTSSPPATLAGPREGQQQTATIAGVVSALCVLLVVVIVILVVVTVIVHKRRRRHWPLDNEERTTTSLQDIHAVTMTNVHAAHTHTKH